MPRKPIKPRSQTAAPAGRSTRRAATYDRQRALKNKMARAASAAGREIGDIPAVAHPRRRSAAAKNFRKFVEAYLAAVFPLAWSKDHLRVIAKIEAAVLKGQLFAFALPRGSGKTSLVEAAALWAAIYGHRSFVCIVGADEGHARRMLESIWAELETNDELLGDFPEVCYPIQRLERIAQRCRGQLHRGMPTRMSKTAGEIILPTIEGSKASGAVMRAVGITGAIRGMAAKRADGSKHRPDLVLVDDPSTDEVSASPAQVAQRLEVMRGAILGLAGPKKSIAGLCTITVIRPDDLADQLLDRDRNPAWQGEKASLVYKWPTAEQLWGEYSDLRRDGQRSGAGVDAANDFYRQQREAMDVGAEVAWPERFNADEISAIQHAYNLRIDRGEAAFAAEFQNEPLRPQLDTAAMSTVSLAGRAITLARGIVPSDHTTMTAAIDVQENLLFWLVASWGRGFSGHVVAYGSHPEQPTPIFTVPTAKRRLEQLYPEGGFEHRLSAGLADLVGMLLGREWSREDGTPHRIEQLVIDANWGRSTEVVRQFCRRHASAAIILPAHGRGIGAASIRGLNDSKPKPGEKHGTEWRTGQVAGQRGLLFSTNWWKSFLAGRLATAIGDPGSLTFHAGDHTMLLEHITAERPVTVEARGRVVDEWRQLPGRDNHLLDCLVMSACAASVAGVEAPGVSTSTKARRKVVIPPAGFRKKIEIRRPAS